MKIKTEKISIKSTKQIDFIDITSKIEELVEKSKIKQGSITVFSSHSTAAICINHNEPMLLQDLTRILYRISPIDERYAHDMFELIKSKKKKEGEGRSNAHSHCKQVFLGSSETIPFEDGKLFLGERQSIFFVELDGLRKRDFVVQIMGTSK